MLLYKDKYYCVRNSPDVMLGTAQYFRVTAVSGCLLDVFRTDVNSLFMSFPREGKHFYLRLKSGSAGAKRQLSSSLRVNQQLQGHPRTCTQLSAVSPFWAPVGPDPIQIWCSCFDVYEPSALKMQDNDSRVRETVIYTNVVNTSSF